MKKQLIATGVIVAALAGVGIYGLSANKSHSTTKPVAIQQVSSSKQIQISNDGKTVDYDGIVGKTALETLKSLTKVDTKSSSYGDMVTGINGLTANSNTEYWGFYVNGKLASEGASTYKAKSGDKIEWRLEKL